MGSRGISVGRHEAHTCATLPPAARPSFGCLLDDTLSRPSQNSLSTLHTGSSKSNDNKNALFQEAEQELISLRKTVLQYRRRLKLSDEECSRFEGNLCTWSEVVDQIQRVKQKEINNDENSSKFRRAYNRIVDSLPAFNGWIQLLPNGDYGSAIFGVFSVIVGASNIAREVRLEVIQCLEAIPGEIRRASKYKDLYMESDELQIIASELAKEILIGLRLITEYAGTSTVKRGISAIGSGSTYKQDLREQIKKIQDVAQDMREEAQLLSNERLLRLETKFDDNFVVLSQLLKDRENQIGLEAFGEHFSDQLAEGLFSRFVKRSRLENSFSGFSINSSADKLKPLQAASHEDGGIDKDILLDALLWSSQHSRDDLNRCLLRGLDLTVKEQERVRWIMRSNHVRYWMKSPTSSCLLLNGNCGGNMELSPPSFMAARLVQALEQVDPIITIHYFCSMHPGAIVSSNTVAVMVMDMIGQLVEAQDSIRFDDLTEEHLELISENDLEALCQLLGELVNSLPTKTVLFWIIDGITMYERFSTKDEFEYFIDALLTMIATYEHVNIKLLLTCSGRSFYIGKMMDQDQILTIPEYIDCSYQGWKGISPPADVDLVGVTANSEDETV